MQTYKGNTEIQKVAHYFHAMLCNGRQNGCTLGLLLASAPVTRRSY